MSNRKVRKNDRNGQAKYFPGKNYEWETSVKDMDEKIQFFESSKHQMDSCLVPIAHAKFLNKKIYTYWI